MKRDRVDVTPARAVGLGPPAPHTHTARGAVGGPEGGGGGGGAHHAGEGQARDVARGLPHVAHLGAGGAVGLVQQLRLRLAEQVGLPGDLGGGAGPLGDAGGHHRVVPPVQQGGRAG